MPCSDGGPTYYDDPYTLDRLNNATKAACDLARKIRKHFPDIWIKLASEDIKGKPYKGIPLLKRSTVDWVHKHDEVDRRRRKEEKEKEERESKVKAALNKLTDKEIKLLNLNVTMDSSDIPVSRGMRKGRRRSGKRF